MDNQEHVQLPGPLTLLKKAYLTYRIHFKTIMPIATLVFLAGVLETITTIGSPDADSIVSFLASLLGFIVTTLSYIALIYMFAYETSPQESSFLDFYHKAWSRFVAYIIVTFLVAFFVGGAFLLFVVPGIIVGVYLIFSVYATVIEGVPGFQALTQSWRYVRGNWWSVLLRIIFFLICLLIFYGIITIILVLIHLPPQDYTSFSIKVILDILIHQFLTSYIILPFTVAYTYLMYEALHTEKAGPILEQEVRVMRNRFFFFVILGVIVLIVAAGVYTWLTFMGHVALPSM